MVSTGRSAMSLESLEVGFCAVSSGSANAGGRAPMESLGRIRRRFRSRWSWGFGDGAWEGVDIAVSRRCRVAHEIGEIHRKFGNGRHGAVSRREKRRGRARRACPLPPTP